MTTEPSRILRSDAQENRDRILTAARELLSERGIDVGMRDVARRAQVGPATLYRRFPTKHDLVHAVFALELATCQEIVESGCADPDPWNGLVSIVKRLTALTVRNRGFVDAFLSTETTDALTLHRQKLLNLLDRLGQRARAAGTLRQDFVINDLVLILLAGRGLSSLPPAGRDHAAGRFATLALDAFRTP